MLYIVLAFNRKRCDMIKLKNVYKQYISKRNDKTTALNNITLEFEDNGMTFILGKSGSGKTTLLNVIGGLDCYDDGEIEILDTSNKQFTEKDYDSYRNTYIGFIFQDFNLLEEYNVYDNITIALKLQKKSIDESKVDDLLLKLNLINFKNRKVNELSGGQKQRVAIARALIKNPKIILADEPTGNLDSETSKQVLDLLKEISKEKLVIIVSHDKESAKNYGDRIIEIKDGNIISDSKKNITNIHHNKYKSIKSKLPFRECIKLGWSSISHKKAKLFFTILLSTFAMIFLSSSFLLTTYNLSQSHARYLKQKGNSYIQIEKKIYKNSADYKGNNINLNAKDIKNISETLNRKDYDILYGFSNKYANVGIVDLMNLNIILDIENDNTDLYTNTEMIPKFMEVDETFDKKNIIGDIPNTFNEIVISNYLADLIIQYGIKTSQTDAYGMYETFYPSNYDELLNSDRYFNLGSIENIKIVGIVQYDIDRFQVLRNCKTISGSDLPGELSNLANFIYNIIYVNEGFIDFYNGIESNILNSNYEYELYSDSIEFKDYLDDTDINYLNNKVEYYNGTEWVQTEKLDENQMILNIQKTKNFILTDYMNQLENYLSNHPDLDSHEAEKNFFANYINTNIIGKHVDLKVRLDDDSIKTYEDIEIVGLVGMLDDESQTYFSKNLLSEYIGNNFSAISVGISENNEKELKKIFDKFPITGEYSAQTPYSEFILVNMDIINMLKKITFYLSIALLLFSIILISNFIFTSINYQKRNIGILRALGARQYDIIKIFLLEGLIIAIFTGLTSAIGLIVVSNIINNTILNGTSMALTPFVINVQIVLTLFVTILVIIIISSVIPLIKFSKMKPVDVIYNK
jgi:ABC-type lipoprotein export system ATPase subunit/ABC-type antimicrobial peptide transport system permease subunit